MKLADVLKFAIANPPNLYYFFLIMETSSNAPSSILILFISPSKLNLRLLHDLNASPSIRLTLFGILKYRKDRQLSNALSPINHKLSEKSKSDKDVQINRLYVLYFALHGHTLLKSLQVHA